MFYQHRVYYQFMDPVRLHRVLPYQLAAHQIICEIKRGQDASTCSEAQ